MRAASGSRPSPSASWPNTRIDPDVTRTSPVTELISVVLPAPFGPQQPEERAVRDREVERVERQRAVVVALRERADLERRRRSCRLSRSIELA